MTVNQPRLLTMTDVSLLARVRRPVPTVWRSRFAERSHPFPTPVRTIAGQDFFDCDEVVEWLEATGSGNNPEAREDAVAFTLTAAEVATTDTAFAGLSALLCLRTMTGPLSTDMEDLLDRAETYDSDDLLLFTEIETLGPRLSTLARYAELLVAAALDPADPFDELVRRRQGTAQQRPLHATLRSLVAKAMIALADDAGFTEPTLVVRSVTDVELVVEAARQAEGRGTLRAAVVPSAAQSSSPDARLARRWLQVHRIPQVEIPDEGEGVYALPDEAVLVLRLATATPDRAADLEEVANLCLNLSERNRAIIVGPAASLTDALLQARGSGRPPAEGPARSVAGVRRSDALRTGCVRAVVRLPRGLLLEQPRSRAAMWCLGPSRTNPLATLCADLSRSLDEAGADDLLTDLVAAMQGPRTSFARDLTAARFWTTSDLVTTPGDLVAPVVRSTSVGASQTVSTLTTLLDRLAEDVPGIVRPGLNVGGDTGKVARSTLGDAVRGGKIAMIAGARIESAATTPGPEVPVVRHPDDLHLRTRPTGLSLVELATSYSHVELTRPGDIVVTTAAGRAAAVDHHGGLLVAYPARVLRCHRPRPSTAEEREQLRARGQHPRDLEPQTFTPEAVAADINSLPADSKDWRAWPLTVLPVGQVAAAEAVLTTLADRRERLLSALGDVEAVIPVLTRAVGAQICTVASPGYPHPSPPTERTPT